MRVFIVGLALVAALSLFPLVAFQTAGDILPGADAPIRLHRIAGDIVPGGS